MMVGWWIRKVGEGLYELLTNLNVLDPGRNVVFNPVITWCCQPGVCGHSRAIRRRAFCDSQFYITSSRARTSVVGKNRSIPCLQLSSCILVMPQSCRRPLKARPSWGFQHAILSPWLLWLVMYNVAIGHCMSSGQMKEMRSINNAILPCLDGDD